MFKNNLLKENTLFHFPKIKRNFEALKLVAFYCKISGRIYLNEKKNAIYIKGHTVKI